MKKVKEEKKKVSKSSTKRAVFERIKTGIKNFDRLIEGGLVKNTTNLVVAGSGGGKSIFATQFLMEGMKEGEHCLYISFEEKRDHFYKNMLEFGWDLDFYEKKGLFYFLEYSPEKVKTMLEEGGGIVESIVLKEKTSRIIIDSITAFELLFKDELEKRELSLELFNLLRKWNCTTLLIYEEKLTAEIRGSTKTIEFESDAIINLYFIRSKKTRKRFIEIIKMRGTSHSKEVYPFNITSHGIELEKEPVSDFSNYFRETQ
jgi:circadian clock protein KaiC